ncbi:hypothetical protein EJB05_28778, partial [Eragrostis curvula]
MASPSVPVAPEATQASRFSGLRQMAVDWIKASWNNLITKEYERNSNALTPEQREDIKRARIKGYLSFCSVGVGAMHLGGAAKVLEHTKGSRPKLVAYSAMYLTFAYWSMVMGMIAGTFHTTSPFPMFFAGFGAWQASLFGLALLHLETTEFYEKVVHAEYSMMIASALATWYWAYAAQDPLPLHSLGKALVAVIIFLWNFICLVFSLPVTILRSEACGKWLPEKFRNHGKHKEVIVRYGLVTPTEW